MLEQILNSLVTPALADTGAASGSSPQSSMSFVIMFIIFFLFIYFTIWRPQNKRAREAQDMLTALSKGDEVVTAGGIVGSIINLNDQFITLAVANNVEIHLQKSSVVNVLPKGTLKSIA
jgi:preprotein translocase subunit YajC